MANGTVKWFNTNKGYGFIQPDNGDKDIFIHISAVEKAGLKTLLENQKVSFEINQDKGRSSAANIKVIGWCKKYPICYALQEHTMWEPPVSHP